MDWWEKCPKFNKRTGTFIKDLSVLQGDISSNFGTFPPKVGGWKHIYTTR